MIYSVVYSMIVKKINIIIIINAIDNMIKTIIKSMKVPFLVIDHILHDTIVTINNIQCVTITNTSKGKC